ncbi:hypothetical protein NSQ90_01275 [Paenibacillus sp. FSL H7-0737]|uniref:hypothetical protein n=1 Tax=Paenibacillus sp. FSL H7-0737 TaxID=1536775 RepID=UPI0030D94E9D
MQQTRAKDYSIFTILLVLAIAFLSPIFIVLMNSFKGKFYISDTPFLSYSLMELLLLV